MAIRSIGFYDLTILSRFGKPVIYKGAVVFGDGNSQFCRSSCEVLRIVPPMPNAQILHEALAQVHESKLRERLYFTDLSADDVLEQIRIFCEGGEPLSDIFNPSVAAFEGLSLFQRVCYESTCRIEHGDTRSYSWLAEKLGKPGAERAVGSAMKTNPFPLLIPCHRVVKKDGTLGGYMGVSSATSSLETWQLMLKKSLLELEKSHRQPSLFAFVN